MKTVKSYTLSPEVQKYIIKEARDTGVSQSSTLERLMRELVILRGHKLPETVEAK